METLRLLPSMEGRRFGTMSLGYDRVDQLREEFSTLLSLAAVMLNTEPEKVTTRDVETLVTELRTKAAAFAPDDQVFDLDAETPPTPREVMAWGLALQSREQATTG